ncbi:hypothetical protein DXC92_07225 [Clostridiales bacterium TF09-2AC]|nr:hypothetical protein DXC92_07225 [Clostridiales bacterium TF09-2AC]
MIAYTNDYIYQYGASAVHAGQLHRSGRHQNGNNRHKPRLQNKSSCVLLVLKPPACGWERAVSGPPPQGMETCRIKKRLVCIGEYVKAPWGEG